MTHNNLPINLFEKDKEIIQSYIWSTAKYDMSKTEKRIMYKIIEAIQYIVRGEDIKSSVQIETDIFSNKKFSIPIRDIFINEGNTNYQYIKDVLEKMRSKNITIETNEIMYITGIIDSITYYKYSGILSFSIRQEMFELLLNFSKGWRSINLDTAMSFDSKYSMRLYEIIASKEQPHTHIFNLESFKSILYLQNKYSRISDFKDRVLDRAKKELDAKSPISFNYSIKKGVITIISYRIGANKQNKILNQEKIAKKTENLSTMLPKEIRYKLRDIGFSDNEMVVNMPTLIDAKHQFNTDELLIILSKLASIARTKENPNGYIINALKGKIKDKYSSSVGSLFADSNI